MGRHVRRRCEVTRESVSGEVMKEVKTVLRDLFLSYLCFIMHRGGLE